MALGRGVKNPAVRTIADEFPRNLFYWVPQARWTRFLTYAIGDPAGRGVALNALDRLWHRANETARKRDNQTKTLHLISDRAAHPRGSTPGQSPSRHSPGNTLREFCRSCTVCYDDQTDLYPSRRSIPGRVIVLISCSSRNVSQGDRRFDRRLARSERLRHAYSPSAAPRSHRRRRGLLAVFSRQQRASLEKGSRCSSPNAWREPPGVRTRR